MSEFHALDLEKEQAASPGISIPERPSGPPKPVMKIAVWPGGPDEDTGERPHDPEQVAQKYEGGEHRTVEVEAIPDDVAIELDLDPGDVLTVTQKPLTHMDDARLIREALQREAGDSQPDEDTPLEPFTFLQVLIDRSVLDSNINIHKPRDKTTRRTLIRDMAVEDTVWWLYAWLGAARIMGRMQRSNTLVNTKKKQRKS